MNPKAVAKVAGKDQIDASAYEQLRNKEKPLFNGKVSSASRGGPGGEVLATNNTNKPVKKRVIMQVIEALGIVFWGLRVASEANDKDSMPIKNQDDNGKLFKNPFAPPAKSKAFGPEIFSILVYFNVPKQ